MSDLEPHVTDPNKSSDYLKDLYLFWDKVWKNSILHNEREGMREAERVFKKLASNANIPLEVARRLSEYSNNYAALANNPAFPLWLLCDDELYLRNFSQGFRRYMGIDIGAEE